MTGNKVDLDMSEPTVKELQKYAKKFLKAGQEYRKAMIRAKIPGAISWYEDTSGGLVIFTRGEYRDTILRNIPEIGPLYHFGGAEDDLK